MRIQLFTCYQNEDPIIHLLSKSGSNYSLVIKMRIQLFTCYQNQDPIIHLLSKHIKPQSILKGNHVHLMCPRFITKDFETVAGGSLEPPMELNNIEINEHYDMFRRPTNKIKVNLD